MKHMSEPTLAQLEAFLVVAEAGSFTAAARSAHVSQPALSRTILAVERQLSVRLFERHKGGVRLTIEGQELQIEARQVLQVHRQSLSRFNTYVSGNRGEFSIAALPSLAASYLPQCVSAFMEDVPDVTVRIHDESNVKIVDQVTSGIADLGLASLSSPSHAVAATEIGADRFVAVLHPAHPLSAHATVAWAELGKRPFVAVSGDSSVRPVTDRAFREVGAHVQNIFEVSQVVTIGGLVAAGLGVSALPEFTLPFVAFADLVVRPLVDPVVRRHIVLLQHAQRPLTPAARRFRALLLRRGRVSARSNDQNL